LRFGSRESDSRFYGVRARLARKLCLQRACASAEKPATCITLKPCSATLAWLECWPAILKPQSRGSSKPCRSLDRTIIGSASIGDSPVWAGTPPTLGSCEWQLGCSERQKLWLRVSAQT